MGTQISVAGEPLCNATTSPSGWAHCGGTVPGDTTTIAAGFDVTYAGNDEHAPSDTHGTLFPRRWWHWWPQHHCTGHWRWTH